MFRVVVGDGAPHVDRDDGRADDDGVLRGRARRRTRRGTSRSRARARKPRTTSGNDDESSRRRPRRRRDAAVTFRARKRYSAFEALHRALTSREEGARRDCRRCRGRRWCERRRCARRAGRDFSSYSTPWRRDRELRACDEVVEFFTSAGNGGGARERATLGGRGDGGRGRRARGRRANETAARARARTTTTTTTTTTRRFRGAVVGWRAYCDRRCACTGRATRWANEGKGETRRDDSSGERVRRGGDARDDDANDDDANDADGHVVVSC